MPADGQGTKWQRNIAKHFNQLSTANKRYRQTTDEQATAYSESEQELTFAKNNYPDHKHCKFYKIWKY